MLVQQAVILCGGKGTRLAERRAELPKPMIPLDGRPVLDHIISNLAKAGIRRFLLAAGYRGEAVAQYYMAPRHPDCRIEVVIEPEPGGTAGALRGCADRLEDDFVLAYGDVFLDFDARRLIAAHEARRPLFQLGRELERPDMGAGRARKRRDIRLESLDVRKRRVFFGGDYDVYRMPVLLKYRGKIHNPQVLDGQILHEHYARHSVRLPPQRPVRDRMKFHRRGS